MALTKEQRLQKLDARLVRVNERLQEASQSGDALNVTRWNARKSVLETKRDDVEAS